MSIPHEAKIALAIGGAVAVGYGVWYAAHAFGLLGSAGGAMATSTAAAPTETAPTTTSARSRTVVGTDSTGAPIYGSGDQTIDKSASSIASRATLAARSLVL